MKVRNRAGIILMADKGLKTKFDPSALRFRNTFQKALELGVDLNNTNVCFKRDGVVYKVTAYRTINGTKRFKEVVYVVPVLILKQIS